MTLMLDDAGTYAIARSPQTAYAQGSVTTLGQNIQRLRLSAGHTNAARFARSIGITPATLNDWESGRYQNLRLDSLLRVARGVPCAIEELLQGVDASYDEIVIARAGLSYTAPLLSVSDQQHENKPAILTLSVPPDRVQKGLLVQKAYEPVHAGGTVVEDVVVRSSSLTVAVELANHVTELRARADAIEAIAHRLTADASRAIDPSAPRASRRGSRARTASKRSSGRGGKG